VFDLKRPELNIYTEDPMNILNSARQVINNSRFVYLNIDNLDPLAKLIKERFDNGELKKIEKEFGAQIMEDLALYSTIPISKIADCLQLIFLENAINFCFWPDKDQPKWTVEWPKGTKPIGGWYGLEKCFKRALDEEIPILDAKYLQELTVRQARRFFRGKSSKVTIPLLKERIDCLREIGDVLVKKFDGKFINVLGKSYRDNAYSATWFVRLIMDNFPSFRDVSSLNRTTHIAFLKRAQVCANDIGYALKKIDKKMSGLEDLTAYADYKIPQILRLFGIIEYDKSLAEKIDNMTEIPHDSREEIEIRSASIWAVELLRQMLGNMTAGEIDNIIWLISQDDEIQSQAKPYHRSRTIFY
jgi:hypothetical protein